VLCYVKRARETVSAKDFQGWRTFYRPCCSKGDPAQEEIPCQLDPLGLEAKLHFTREDPDEDFDASIGNRWSKQGIVSLFPVRLLFVTIALTNVFTFFISSFFYFFFSPTHAFAFVNSFPFSSLWSLRFRFLALPQIISLILLFVDVLKWLTHIGTVKAKDVLQEYGMFQRIEFKTSITSNHDIEKRALHYEWSCFWSLFPFLVVEI
jgi:hypothetical protein